MDMSIVAPSQHAPLYVPVEVCEQIIDTLYSDNDISKVLEYAATLRSCALVCRAWRVRAQRMLFHSVYLGDMASLYRFSAVLQAGGKHLEAYVHEVILSGRSLQTTASMLSPFLAIFQAAKLPNLHRLAVVCVLDSTKWHPSASASDSASGSGSRKAKPLPYIPLHPRFPTLLSTFTTLSTLQFEETRFRTFGEFARIVASLPNLQVLVCNSARWNTLGAAFPGHGADGTGPWSRPPFPLKLRSIMVCASPGSVKLHGSEVIVHVLQFWNNGSHAAKWLLSACGRSPSLTSLNIGIPLGAGPGEPEDGVEIDLSSFSELNDLTIRPTSTKFVTEKRCSDLMKAMLTSWKPRHPDPHLVFGASDWSHHFTRDEFACMLEVVGAVTESWRPEIADTSGEVKHLFFINVYEREEHLREQWVGCFLDAFPTWLRLGGLVVRILKPPSLPFNWRSNSRVQESSAPVESASSTAPQPEASDSQLSSKNDFLRPMVLADRSHPTSFSLTLPLPAGLYEVEVDRGIDPIASLQLNELRLALSPRFSAEAHGVLIEEALSSWRPRDEMPVLLFHPDLNSKFTRRGFVDALRAVGVITERLLRPIQETLSRASSSEEKDTRTRCKVAVMIWDWEPEGEWWWDHVQSCFPTWAREGQMFMDFKSLRLTSQDESCEWVSEEQALSLRGDDPHSQALLESMDP